LSATQITFSNRKEARQAHQLADYALVAFLQRACRVGMLCRRRSFCATSHTPAHPRGPVVLPRSLPSPGAWMSDHHATRCTQNARSLFSVLFYEDAPQQSAVNLKVFDCFLLQTQCAGLTRGPSATAGLGTSKCCLAIVASGSVLAFLLLELALLLSCCVLVLLVL
jgi:hypothetical protein